MKQPTEHDVRVAPGVWRTPDGAYYETCPDDPTLYRPAEQATLARLGLTGAHYETCSEDPTLYHAVRRAVGPSTLATARSW